MTTLGDIIRASSYRLDDTIPYIPEEGPEPDPREVLLDSLFICNCPSYSKTHRH